MQERKATTRRTKQKAKANKSKKTVWKTDKQGQSRRHSARTHISEIRIELVEEEEEVGEQADGRQ